METNEMKPEEIKALIEESKTVLRSVLDISHVEKRQRLTMHSVAISNIAIAETLLVISETLVGIERNQ